MNSNNQLYLLYDDACPLCNWYTEKFVTAGLMHSESRLPYTRASLENNLELDYELAKNKIALLNTETKQTLYGIDSLLYILGQRFPLISKIGHWKPVHFLLDQFYNFISYNRKAIAPVHVCKTDCSCDPSVSYSWRIAYILVSALIIHASVSFYFSSFLSDHLVSNPVPDFLLFGSQFIYQFLTFSILKQKDFYVYSGHLTTVSLIGAMLLLFFGGILLFLEFLRIDIHLLAPLCFGIVMTFMFVIHFNRIKKLGYSSYLTVSWVLFRLSIYALVFKLF
jgi:predicted DCC family thiol-disulfide oxidoreductase YuxK